MSAGTRHPRRPGWSQSATFRAIGRAAIIEWNKKRATLPKCGATRRNGEPCQKPGMANGRCHLHGGRTPKGDNWHKPVFPDRNSKRASERLNSKLQDLDKRRKKRARRLAKLSPEQQEQHAAWHKAHKPGPPGPRARERARRAQNKALRDEWQNRPAEPPALSAERQELADVIDKLKRKLERLRRPAVAEPETNTGDIFG
jgi:hypothetical protein